MKNKKFVYQTILRRRSIRLFKDKRINRRLLKKLINAGRLAPSARNLQPIEYLVVDRSDLCEKIFENVKFGGEVERLRKKENQPVAYILVLINKNIREEGFEHDVGLALENIILSACEEGIGACILGAIERENIVEIFNLPKNYYLDLILALGWPAERPVKEEGWGRIWRDERGILHIPKRRLEEILHWNKI